MPVHTSNPAGRTVTLPPVGCEGDLAVPEGAKAVVVFAHGSGSSRFSPRNNYVAAGLRKAGLGTLLFDLLTAAEEQDRKNVFDIPLLAERLGHAIGWVGAEPGLEDLGIGLFGASTGAAAALVADAEAPGESGAIVSRGGRPDLAGPWLAKVRAPTLLIVGGDDAPVLDLNREALEELTREKRLEVVPGATHLFEEPGALDRVIELAGDWFTRHLAAGGSAG